MYSTNHPNWPLPPQAPAIGILIASTNQNYPTQSYMQPAAKVLWSTGLCDCFSDVSNCCITCWCPCITFGQIAEIVDQGSTSCGASGALYALICFLTGCAWIYSCCYRSRMRNQYLLVDGPCCDCCVHFCCESCALCQEYRELKNHGFDMSLGWHGNMVRRQNRAVMPTAPVVESGMQKQRDNFMIFS